MRITKHYRCDSIEDVPSTYGVRQANFAEVDPSDHSVETGLPLTIKFFGWSFKGLRPGNIIEIGMDVESIPDHPQQAAQPGREKV